MSEAPVVVARGDDNDDDGGGGGGGGGRGGTVLGASKRLFGDGRTGTVNDGVNLGRRDFKKLLIKN